MSSKKKSSAIKKKKSSPEKLTNDIARLKAQAEKEAQWIAERKESNRLKSRLVTIMTGGFASVIVFAFIGSRLDAHWMTNRTWTIVGVFLALTWIFYEMLKLVLSLTNESINKKPGKK